MKNILHLALHNLKKDTKSYLSFGTIIFLTALILNMALVLTFRIDAAYDEKAAELHAADLALLVPQAADSQALCDDIAALDSVAYVERRSGRFANAVVKDFRGADFEMNLVFYNQGEYGRLNDREWVERSQTDMTNPIYLPLYLAEFGEFAVGDAIVFAADHRDYTFHVAGVYQEMQYGNVSGGIMGVCLPKEEYDALAETGGEDFTDVADYAIRLTDDADQKQALNEVSKTAEDNGAPVLFRSTAQDKKQARTMVSQLLILFLLTFSFIVLLVSMFLIKFRIQNTVQEEMSQMGVLKALGFTSGMIIAAVVLPYAAVSLLFAAIGAAASYAVLPVLMQMLALQAGFRFAIGFDAGAMMIATGAAVAVTLFFTYTAAGRIRRLHPILAIRGEGESGKVRRNHFAMDRTPGGANVLLMLKHMSSSAGQNMLLFAVLFFLTIMISFSGNLFYNVIIRPDHFTNTLFEESPSVILTVSDSELARIQSALQRQDGVVKVLQYAQQSLKADSMNVTAFVCEDFGQVNNDLCYEGRNPHDRNEVAVGNAVAETTGCRIGDTIPLTYGEETQYYRIVGLVQGVNYNSGEVCELTSEGFARLAPQQAVGSLYVYLEEGTDADEFIRQTEQRYPCELVKSVNYEKSQAEAQSLFSAIVNIFITAIFLLTALIVLLILFLIIQSMITQRKQEFGICKAIGYAGRQLVMQVAGSFLPVAALAVISSALLGCVYVPAMNKVIFGMVGAIKNSMEVPLYILLLFAAVELLLTFVISIVLARPIKRITAYSLIKE